MTWLSPLQLNSKTYPAQVKGLITIYESKPRTISAYLVFSSEETCNAAKSAIAEVIEKTNSHGSDFPNGIPEIRKETYRALWENWKVCPVLDAVVTAVPPGIVPWGYSIGYT